MNYQVPHPFGLMAEDVGMQQRSVIAMHDAQLEALRSYTLLVALRPSWTGALVVSLGLTPEALAIPFGAIIAGAACVAIEPDPLVCRAAMRTGACDFVVNTLDEGLRILKNEIRQHRPVSVGIESSIAPALAELRQRGVLPQLFVDPSGSYDPLGQALSDTAAGEVLAAANGWTLQSFPCETSPELRAFDARLLSVVPAIDLRRAWITTAPRLFPRDRTRHVYLASAELDQLRVASA